MNNIIALNTYAQHSQPAYVIPTASPIAFTAYERPMWYEGKTDSKFEVGTHKALVRMTDDGPTVLNVVRDTYKMVQNRELFDVVEKGLHDALGQEANNAVIVDKVAHNGRLCYRQYQFKDINVESPERDKIVFRVIIQNGFGGSAIKLHAGAIDMFCTNGMILGDYVSEYAKHTSGLKIACFTETVRKAADVFWKNKDTWNDLRGRALKREDTALAYLIEQFGERLGTKLFRQYLIECKARGGSNMWALYSALTYYASWATGDFELRNTKNDHAAASMLKREHDVHRVWRDPKFMELVA